MAGRRLRLCALLVLLGLVLASASLAGGASGNDQARLRFRRTKATSKNAVLDAGARLLSALLGGFSFSFPSLSLPEA